MYDIKEEAIISYNQLISHMDPYSYYTVPFRTGLCSQMTLITKQLLCVDDFGVKHFTKDDANHLLDYLKKHYAISIEFDDRNYP